MIAWICQRLDHGLEGDVLIRRGMSGGRYVDAARREAARHQAELIARWRAYETLRTGETPTCSDEVALALAELAASVGRL